MDVPLSSSTLISTSLKALLRLAGLLCLVSVATFVLLSYSPIDPIKAYIGNDLLHVPPEQYARIAARWGLDQPLWLRYWHWFSQVLQGDLGYSMLYNAPVSEVIGQRFAASFLLLALFAVHWPLLPVCCAWTPGLSADEADWAMRARHLLLPVTTLALLGLGNIALHTRARVAEVLESDFIRYARAQGDDGWPMLRFHVLRHALTPALCLQFASLGELIGGSLLAEKVFSYPGLGQATVDAGLRGDIPLLMGIVLFCTLLVFIGNTVASLLLARINRGWEGEHAV